MPNSPAAPLSFPRLPVYHLCIYLLVAHSRAHNRLAADRPLADHADNSPAVGHSLVEARSLEGGRNLAVPAAAASGMDLHAAGTASRRSFQVRSSRLTVVETGSR